MDLNAVRMFIGIVQAGSFSQAAERLGIPLATLSRNLAALEKHLQVQLLERSKAGVAPTLAGQKLYEQSVGSIESLLQAERNLHQDELTLSGRLRISTPPLFFPGWDCVAAFQHQHPRVQVHCAVGSRVVGNFFSDDVDAAFRIGDLRTDAVIAKPLIQLDSVLVATPGFIEAHGAPQSLEALAHFPCASWSDGGEVDFSRVFQRKPPAIKACFTSNDIQAVLHHALQGLSIAVLPPYCVADELQRGALVEILPDEPKREAPVHLIYPAHKHPPAVLRAFSEFCVAWFRGG